MRLRRVGRSRVVGVVAPPERAPHWKRVLEERGFAPELAPDPTRFDELVGDRLALPLVVDADLTRALPIGLGGGQPLAWPRHLVGLALRDPLESAMPPTWVAEADTHGLTDALEAAFDRAALDPVFAIRGRSAAIREVRSRVRDVAEFREVSVMIVGETGSGKELVAEAIHRLQSSVDGRFVPLNCTAVPAALFESELFGHAAGAFTGSGAAREGLLAVAGDGTVFLDEVVDMPRELQPKLLRALELRQFRPVGANREQMLRARIVSATNRPPLAGEGLREDLFYRLSTFTIPIPPLRERPEDIPELAEVLLAGFCARHRMDVPELRRGVLDVMADHRWPGNVRELRAVLEQAVVLSNPGELEEGAVREAIAGRSPHAFDHEARETDELIEPHEGLRQLEHRLIVERLRANDGNVAKTARELGLPRSTLRARLRRYEEGE